MSGCFGNSRRAYLQSHRSLSLQQNLKKDKDEQKSGSSETLIDSMLNARISASTAALAREDLLPCESLPPRKLTYTDGRVNWLDGSWARQARAYVVKGSAETDICHLEIRPWGHININPGGKDAFIRGRQIHVLLANPNGDTFVPPSNAGRVRCVERDGSFQITAENTFIGNSPISYVTNEGVPLVLASKVCLARFLSSEQVPLNEWALVIPALNFNAGLRK